jgi:hypothetical protein
MAARVRVTVALAALALTLGIAPHAASSAEDPVAAAAGCGSLQVDGARFVFYKQGLSCKKAKGLARGVYRTNKPPRGWKCPDGSPGHNRRDGGQCYRPGTDKSFGWHVGD